MQDPSLLQGALECGRAIVPLSLAAAKPAEPSTGRMLWLTRSFFRTYGQISWISSRKESGVALKFENTRKEDRKEKLGKRYDTLGSPVPTVNSLTKYGS